MPIFVLESEYQTHENNFARVGRTVEQHYITAINDYIQRTKRFITLIWK